MNREDVLSLRRVMEDFWEARLQTKLEDKQKKYRKLAQALAVTQVEEKEELKAKEEADAAKLRDKFSPEAWLDDAAKRSKQLKLVTHSLKYIHSGVEHCSDCFATYSEPLQAYNHLIGTFSVQDLPADVTGNAAALDVYKFLTLKYNDLTLLELMQQDSELLKAAFSDIPEQAQNWFYAFKSMQNMKYLASHTLLRQIYFPLPDGSYHLLSPLFPSSLAHTIYQTLQEDIYGAAAKQAREAHKKDEVSANGYCEYPDLLMQKFGGTKPQNISQLNSERGGSNWLLASCPPIWKEAKLQLPLQVNTVFGRILRRNRLIRNSLQALSDFLGKTDYNNHQLREARARLVEALIDAILQWAAEIQQNAGWSTACNLPMTEQLWLDPWRDDPDFQVQYASETWQDFVAKSFARWLNFELRNSKQKYALQVGDPEYWQWQKDFTEALRTLEGSHA